eukprot:gene36391-49014_t
MAAVPVRGRSGRALQVLEACQLLGLHVPEQVAVLGVDNDELVCELANPPLSSVQPNARRSGYEAAALLARLMRGEKTGVEPMHQVQPPHRPIYDQALALAKATRGVDTPLGRVLAILLLIVFALFFVVPLIWLFLAPTKTDRQLLLDGPFSLGSFSTLVDNWNSLATFQHGLLWTWIGNSAFYCIAALVITLVISIPAGYAMALTEFRGRKALLATTLIVMMIPNTALVLPIFLELSAVKLIGNPLASIL